MKNEVECISPTDTVQAAARKMRDANLGFLPVCDESKNVLGTVTDRDLAMRILAEARPATTAVQEMMTNEVISCGSEDDLRTAEEPMAKNHKSRIMCLNRSGELMGVISLTDIAECEDGVRFTQTLRRISERPARMSA